MHNNGRWAYLSEWDEPLSTTVRAPTRRRAAKVADSHEATEYGIMAKGVIPLQTRASLGAAKHVSNSACAAERGDGRSCSADE